MKYCKFKFKDGKYNLRCPSCKQKIQIEPDNLVDGKSIYYIDVYGLYTQCPLCREYLVKQPNGFKIPEYPFIENFVPRNKFD